MTDPFKVFAPTSTLQEMIDAAKHYNAGQIQMVYRNAQDEAITAVIVIRGEWTKDVLKAINQLEEERQTDETGKAIAKQRLLAVIRDSGLSLEPTEWLDLLVEIQDEIIAANLMP